MSHITLVRLKECCRSQLWKVLGVLLLLVSSCTQVEVPGISEESGEDAIVLLKVDAGKAVTRAGGEYGTEPFNSGAVLVFNENQVCEQVQSFDARKDSITLTVREGTKNFYVVGNASADLVAALKSIHWEQDLLGAVSRTGDYNTTNGGKPTQGLLLTGGVTKATVSSSQSLNEVTVNLTVALAGVDFRIAKGGSDVGDITVKSLKVHNARSVGYLYKDGVSGTTPKTFNPEMTTTNVAVTGAEDTSVSTFYTYPLILSGSTDFYFTLTVRHAGAQADDVYTIYPNAKNVAAGGVDFRKGYFYKVIITFSRDETGNLTVAAYVTDGINNDFEFGR